MQSCSQVDSGYCQCSNSENTATTFHRYLVSLWWQLFLFEITFENLTEITPFWIAYVHVMLVFGYVDKICDFGVVVELWDQVVGIRGSNDNFTRSENQGHSGQYDRPIDRTSTAKAELSGMKLTHNGSLALWWVANNFTCGLSQIFHSSSSTDVRMDHYVARIWFLRLSCSTSTFRIFSLWIWLKRRCLSCIIVQNEVPP